MLAAPRSCLAMSPGDLDLRFRSSERRFFDPPRLGFSSSGLRFPRLRFRASAAPFWCSGGSVFEPMALSVRSPRTTGRDGPRATRDRTRDESTREAHIRGESRNYLENGRPTSLGVDIRLILRRDQYLTGRPARSGFRSGFFWSLRFAVIVRYSTRLMAIEMRRASWDRFATRREIDFAARRSAPGVDIPFIVTKPRSGRPSACEPRQRDPDF